MTTTDLLTQLADYDRLLDHWARKSAEKMGFTFDYAAQNLLEASRQGDVSARRRLGLDPIDGNHRAGQLKALIDAGIATDGEAAEFDAWANTGTLHL